MSKNTPEVNTLLGIVLALGLVLLGFYVHILQKDNIRTFVAQTASPATVVEEWPGLTFCGKLGAYGFRIHHDTGDRHGYVCYGLPGLSHAIHWY